MKTCIRILTLALIVSPYLLVTNGIAQQPNNDQALANRNLRDAETVVNSTQQQQPALLGQTPNTMTTTIPQQQPTPFQGPNTTRQGVMTYPELIASTASQAPTLMSDRIIELTLELKKAEQDEDESKITTIKAELKTLLEKQYDTYLVRYELPLKQMEKRLAKLRKEFEWRKSARDDLVKLRLDTLWYEIQGLSWPTQNQNRLYNSQQLIGGNLPGTFTSGAPNTYYGTPVQNSRQGNLNNGWLNYPQHNRQSRPRILSSQSNLPVPNNTSDRYGSSPFASPPNTTNAPLKQPYSDNKPKPKNKPNQNNNQ